jgi:hypothetical protein
MLKLVVQGELAVRKGKVKTARQASEDIEKRRKRRRR